jgi:predicted enzyme related to lactoylglutathione lyase
VITGIDFVSVGAVDFEAAVRFYEEVLQLPCTARYGRMPGVEFKAGDVTIQVLESKAFGMEFRPTTHPIALRVDDVGEARAALESRGVEFAHDTIDSGVCHMAVFHDPAGNTLMLHHRYAA